MYRVTLDFANGTSQVFDDVENYNVEEVEEEVEEEPEEETDEEADNSD